MKLLFALGCVAVSILGCSATCSGACQHDYEKCMDRSPPGAARSDCQAQYDTCVKQCNS
jgi:hypothetical protein